MIETTRPLKWQNESKYGKFIFDDDNCRSKGGKEIFGAV